MSIFRDDGRYVRDAVKKMLLIRGFTSVEAHRLTDEVMARAYLRTRGNPASKPAFYRALAALEQAVAEEARSPEGVRSLVPEAMLLLHEEAHLRAALADLEPPPAGSFLLCLFVNAKDREAVLGDLEEAYQRAVQRFGVRKARWIYYSDVVRSLGPVFTVWFRNTLVAAAVGEIWKRVFRG